MKTKILTMFLLAVILIPAKMKAQTASIDNVKAFYLKNVDAIVENNEVKGYNAFYLVDRKSRKESIYKLAIWDKNLNKKYDIDFVRPSSVRMLESSYNGGGFCYSFYNSKERSLEYITFNKQGEETGSYQIYKLSKFETQTIAAKVQAENNEFFGGLAAIPGEGFVRYGLDSDKGRSVDIELIDNFGELVWSESIYGDDKNDYVTAVPLATNSEYIASNVYMRESYFSQKIKRSMLKLHDAKTGKELFSFKGKGVKYQYSFYGVDFQKEHLIAYGEYFNKADNPFKDDSKGLFILFLDQSGKVLKEEYISWSAKLKRKVPKLTMTDKGKKVNFVIHRIVKTADNKYFVFCEQYNRAADALGIAANVLNGGYTTSVTKIVTRDIVLLELNENLELIKGHIIEKEKNSIGLPAGMDFYGNAFVAYYIKATGQFSYCYTNLSPDGKTFSSSYVNFNREGKGSRYVVGNITYTKEKKIATDEIPLDDKPSSFMVLPSKPGYVCIFEYYRKTKTIQIRLEKARI